MLCGFRSQLPSFLPSLLRVLPSTLISFLSVLLEGDKGRVGAGRGRGGMRADEQTDDGRLRCPSSALTYETNSRLSSAAQGRPSLIDSPPFSTFVSSGNSSPLLSFVLSLEKMDCSCCCVNPPLRAPIPFQLGSTQTSPSMRCLRLF